MTGGRRNANDEQVQAASLSMKKLKVGDKIRILEVPGKDIPGYFIHKDTVQVYKRIIARKRAVRISSIDEYDQPWYTVKFRRKNGSWEYHWLAVMEGDTNWVRVRKKT